MAALLATLIDYIAAVVGDTRSEVESDVAYDWNSDDPYYSGNPSEDDVFDYIAEDLAEFLIETFGEGMTFDAEELVRQFG